MNGCFFHVYFGIFCHGPAKNSSEHCVIFDFVPQGGEEVSSKQRGLFKGRRVGSKGKAVQIALSLISSRHRGNYMYRL